MINPIILSIKDICLVKSNKFSKEFFFEKEERKCNDNPKTLIENITSALNEIKENWSSIYLLSEGSGDSDGDRYAKVTNNFLKEGKGTATTCRKIPWETEMFKNFVYDMDSVSPQDQQKIIRAINNAIKRTNKNAKIYNLLDIYLDTLDDLGVKGLLDKMDINESKALSKQRVKPFITLNRNLELLKKRHNI